MRSAEITGLIDRWVADGLITAEQGSRMRADLTPSGRRVSLLAEGMGYLGGALVLVALGLLTGWYWADLHALGRLAVVGGAAVALVAAGASVPRGTGGATGRLRAVLWFGACAALFGFLILLADQSLDWTGRTAVLFAAAAVLPCAVVLWAAHRHPVQHLATYVSILVLAASLVAQLPSAGALPAVAVGAAGLAWGLLAWGGVIRPAPLGRTLGALGGVAGAVVVADQEWGSAVALAVVALLTVAAVLMRDLVVLAVASVGTVLVLPTVVTRYFPGTVSAALALLAAGLLLVAAAVLAAWRPRAAGRDRPSGTRRDWTTGPARVAVGGAVALVAGATAAVLIAGQ